MSCKYAKPVGDVWVCGVWAAWWDLEKWLAMWDDWCSLWTRFVVGDVDNVCGRTRFGCGRCVCVRVTCVRVCAEWCLMPFHSLSAGALGCGQVPVWARRREAADADHGRECFAHALRSMSYALIIHGCVCQATMSVHTRGLVQAGHVVSDCWKYLCCWVPVLHMSCKDAKPVGDVWVCGVCAAWWDLEKCLAMWDDWCCLWTRFVVGDVDNVCGRARFGCGRCVCVRVTRVRVCAEWCLMPFHSLSAWALGCGQVPVWAWRREAADADWQCECFAHALRSMSYASQLGFCNHWCLYMMHVKCACVCVRHYGICMHKGAIAGIRIPGHA